MIRQPCLKICRPIEKQKISPGLSAGILASPCKQQADGRGGVARRKLLKPMASVFLSVSGFTYLSAYVWEALDIAGEWKRKNKI